MKAPSSQAHSSPGPAPEGCPLPALGPADGGPGVQALAGSSHPVRRPLRSSSAGVPTAHHLFEVSPPHDSRSPRLMIAKCSRGAQSVDRSVRVRRPCRTCLASFPLSVGALHRAGFPPHLPGFEHPVDHPGELTRRRHARLRPSDPLLCPFVVLRERALRRESHVRRDRRDQLSPHPSVRASGCSSVPRYATGTPGPGGEPRVGRQLVRRLEPRDRRELRGQEQRSEGADPRDRLEQEGRRVAPGLLPDPPVRHLDLLRHSVDQPQVALHCQRRIRMSHFRRLKCPTSGDEPVTS
jgi:hypothetical protein